MWRRRAIALAGLCLACAGIALAVREPHSNRVPWPMFHRDERHTGVITGTGTIPAGGPLVHWTYQVATVPPDPTMVRWATSFPLADVDGDGRLDIVVTSPTTFPANNPPGEVLLLQDVGGFAARVRWTYPVTSTVDTYSPALADVDGDGLPDVIFSSSDGRIRALRGADGELLWWYDTTRVMESGPMLADLDGDGALEVVIVTDCKSGGPQSCPAPNAAALYVFAARPPAQGENPPLWSLELPYKLDSGQPAIADFDPNDGRALKQIVFGTWGSRLHVVWRDPITHAVIDRSLDVATLDPNLTPTPGATPVVRTAPLVVDYGTGELTAVFGWMPEYERYTDARLSAVNIHVDTVSGNVSFASRWPGSLNVDDWKSSPALVLPPPPTPPLVVSGFGVGTNTNNGVTGLCETGGVQGGALAVNPLGTPVWQVTRTPDEGNVRASAAIADVDDDGRPEMILPYGCYGKLHAYDALTGAQDWEIQLGSRVIASPSIGDVDGDGHVEIVVGDYDGRLWVLGGPTYHVLLPVMVR
jgi:outer membrane protein assembly factor BamB